MRSGMTMGDIGGISERTAVAEPVLSDVGLLNGS